MIGKDTNPVNPVSIKASKDRPEPCEPSAETVISTYGCPFASIRPCLVSMGHVPTSFERARMSDPHEMEITLWVFFLR